MSMPQIRSGSTVFLATNQEWIHCVPCHESGVDPLCPCHKSGVDPLCPMPQIRSGSTVSHATNQSLEGLRHFTSSGEGDGSSRVI